MPTQYTSEYTYPCSLEKIFEIYLTQGFYQQKYELLNTDVETYEVVDTRQENGIYKSKTKAFAKTGSKILPKMSFTQQQLQYAYEWDISKTANQGKVYQRMDKLPIATDTTYTMTSLGDNEVKVQFVIDATVKLLAAKMLEKKVIKEMLKTFAHADNVIRTQYL